MIQHGAACFESGNSPQVVVRLMLEKMGEDFEIDVAIEEMSELIKELLKYKRSKVLEREKQAASREHVVEEIGDVMFMFEYLKTIFNISEDEIKKTVEQKAKRTKERYIDAEE
jgi:NTP pyrophosphatase (non-canonical NTP hydrolase)